MSRTTHRFKLGLIAMSGVRIRNERLLSLGLTLPGFVERGRVVATLPSLALLTLAGLTPPSVEVRYLEIPSLSAIAGLPEEFDAVAISSYTAQINDAYELADRYRRAGIQVILGGLHVSALPAEAALHADAVVLGEAEAVWPQVVHDLANGSLQQVYDGRATSFDLSTAPMPRFELLDPNLYNRITVQTQRGCPFACEFCASSIRLTPRFKIKPVTKVIQEVRRIKELWQKPFIELADDNTFANPTHGRQLAKALEKEDIRWFTETDVSIADNGDLLKLLADSGCAQLLIGFEAPDRNALEGLETKANWKAEQAERYLEAIGRIQSHGITVNGCFMMGLDAQDETAFQAVQDFVRKSRLCEVQVTLQTPFPGTPLRTRLEAEGRLLKGDSWDRYTLFDITYEPLGMTAIKLEQRFHELIASVYADEAVGERRSYTRNLLRASRAARRHSSAS